MYGLTSLSHHLIAIGLIWLTVIIITQIVKWAALKGMKKVQKGNRIQKSTINKIAFLIRISTTAIAMIVAIIFVLFMYNPLERSYDEMDKINPATTNEEFVEPTKEEIEKSNKDATEKEHEKEKTEAERDNKKAMDDADEIFRENKKKEEAKSD